jgi:hypothetical protein
LVIATGCLALDDELLRHRQQGQENINVDIVVGQVADIDGGCAGLNDIVPDDVAIARIAARCCGISAVQKEV